MLEKIKFCFDLIEDHRVEGKILYPLHEILFCLLIGNLCNSNDLEDIVFLCEEKLDFLRQYFPFSYGIASISTFLRVLEAIDHKHFSALLTAIYADISDNKELRQLLNIDGKSICGSGNSKSEIVHLTSAYSHYQGIVIAQEKVSGKSNEITAIPDLLSKLSLKNTAVTIDAMGCQKNIANQIVKQGGDYVLGLKGNQGTLHKDVQLFFKETNKNNDFASFADTDAGHGRIEQRTCVITNEINWLKDLHPDWKNLQTIVQITSNRYDKKSKKESVDTRYYISSLQENAENLLKITRSHWAIENNLHWCLDVIWGEDACQIKQKNATTNLATVRRIAFNILKLNKDKIPLKRKRLKATLSNNFLKSLLN
jgi:predicted transposase YbfD/YdcC